MSSARGGYGGIAIVLLLAVVGPAARALAASAAPAVSNGPAGLLAPPPVLTGANIPNQYRLPLGPSAALTPPGPTPPPPPPPPPRPGPARPAVGDERRDMDRRAAADAADDGGGQHGPRLRRVPARGVRDEPRHLRVMDGRRRAPGDDADRGRRDRSGRDEPERRRDRGGPRHDLLPAEREPRRVRVRGLDGPWRDLDAGDDWDGGDPDEPSVPVVREEPRRPDPWGGRVRRVPDILHGRRELRRRGLDPPDALQRRREQHGRVAG